MLPVVCVDMNAAVQTVEKKMTMLDKDQAAALMARYLRQAAKAHLAGNHENIEYGFEDMDNRLPRNGGPEWDNLLIALHFWDGWIDARNHDWRYYEPLTSEDWPVLAEHIARDLEAGHDISDQAVLDKFYFRSID